MKDFIELPAVDRMVCVINYAFGGEHHTKGLKKNKDGNGFEWWEFTVCGPLCTEDFDDLTKLVISSLEYGVRVEVDSGGPHRIRVRLFPRKQRDGVFHERIGFTFQHLAEFYSSGRLNREAKEAKP